MRLRVTPPIQHVPLFLSYLFKKIQDARFVRERRKEKVRKERSKHEIMARFSSKRPFCLLRCYRVASERFFGLDRALYGLLQIMLIIWKSLEKQRACQVMRQQRRGCNWIAQSHRCSREIAPDESQISIARVFHPRTFPEALIPCLYSVPLRPPK